MSDWIAEHEPLAYGSLGLRPAEFAAMTPREFRLLAAGAADRDERLYAALAWHAANVMAPHLKRAVQPHQLLGKPARPRPRKRGREGR